MDAAKVVKEQKEMLRGPNASTIADVKKFVALMNRALKAARVGADAVLGGSVAKSTFLHGKFDADIFIRFDRSYKDKDMSDVLEKALRKAKLSTQRLHGSRDYFQHRDNASGITYELVPVLKIRDASEAVSVIDMSPMHVSYFNSKAAAMKRRGYDICEEVKLTKLFMKSAGVYGAESYIHGFSGHVVDLLIIKYGTFLSLLRSALRWPEKIIIDIEKRYKNAHDVLMSLNASKTEGPLVIVDPVQRTRNASAAVSKQTLDAFVDASKRFLRSPSPVFFIRKSFDEVVSERAKRFRNANAFVIDVTPLEKKLDVAAAKALQAYEFMLGFLERKGFRVAWSGWEFGAKDARFAFLVDADPKQRFGLVKGPPLSMPDAVLAFRKAHKSIVKKGGVVYAKERTRFMTPQDCFRTLMEDPAVLGKVKKLRLRK